MTLSETDLTYSRPGAFGLSAQVQTSVMRKTEEPWGR